MNGPRVDYDWVVIGSGFGGSVSALRLAEKEHTNLDKVLKGLIDRLDALTSGAKTP